MTYHIFNAPGTLTQGAAGPADLGFASYLKDWLGRNKSILLTWDNRINLNHRYGEDIIRRFDSVVFRNQVTSHRDHHDEVFSQLSQQYPERRFNLITNMADHQADSRQLIEAMLENDFKHRVTPVRDVKGMPATLLLLGLTRTTAGLSAMATISS